MSTVPDQLATALAERYAIEREPGQGGMATVYLVMLTSTTASGLPHSVRSGGSSF
jgi:hypothetical protein